MRWRIILKLIRNQSLCIYDDIDLEPGQLRIRKQGSAGGHNGIKDIIRQLGTEKFLRIKVGVGAKPKGWDLADHVLGRFSTEDRKLVDEAITKAAKAVDIIISQGTDAAMNEYNRKSTCTEISRQETDDCSAKGIESGNWKQKPLLLRRRIMRGEDESIFNTSAGACRV